MQKIYLSWILYFSKVFVFDSPNFHFLFFNLLERELYYILSILVLSIQMVYLLLTSTVLYFLEFQQL